MNLSFKPKPQSKPEFIKNEKRIRDLIDKCDGDKQKEVNKAAQMAASIDTPEKAYNRGFVAKEMGYDHIFEVFYERAYELGVVSIAEHRDHQIDNILSDKDIITPLKKEKTKNYILVENEELKSFSTNGIEDEISDSFINHIIEIIKLTSRVDFDDFDEYKLLCKKLTLKKIKKIIENQDAIIYNGSNDIFNKIFSFAMDSDELRYECEIHLSLKS